MLRGITFLCLAIVVDAIADRVKRSTPRLSLKLKFVIRPSMLVGGVSINVFDARESYGGYVSRQAYLFSTNLRNEYGDAPCRLKFILPN